MNKILWKSPFKIKFMRKKKFLEWGSNPRKSWKSWKSLEFAPKIWISRRSDWIYDWFLKYLDFILRICISISTRKFFDRSGITPSYFSALTFGLTSHFIALTHWIINFRSCLCDPDYIILPEPIPSTEDKCEDGKMHCRNDNQCGGNGKCIHQ